MKNDIQKVKVTKKDSNIGEIEVDRDLCIGAGTCEVLAPNTFKLDKEGKVYIDDVNSHTDQEIIDAAKSCPVFAIKIYDKNGKQLCP